MAKQILGQLTNGLKVIEYSWTGPSSYTSGGVSVTIPAKKIVAVLSLRAVNAGYIIEEKTVSGNSLTYVVRYFDYDATADGVAIEATGANLSGVTFKGIFLVL